MLREIILTISCWQSSVMVVVLDWMKSTSSSRVCLFISFSRKFWEGSVVKSKWKEQIWSFRRKRGWRSWGGTSLNRGRGSIECIGGGCCCLGVAGEEGRDAWFTTILVEAGSNPNMGSSAASFREVFRLPLFMIFLNIAKPS